MTNRCCGSMMAMAVAVAVLSLASVPAAGQAPPAATKAWNPSRTQDGQPDMQGIWTYRGPGMATYSIERGASEEHEKITGRVVTREAPLIVDPPDGKVPYQPWAEAKRKEIKDNYQNPTKLEYVDPDARCFLAGVPRIHYESQPFQILQPPGYVVILYEWTHAYRIIPLDGRPHVAESIKLWLGSSRGHWEGNTLVVDSTGYNDKTWFDIVGTFHSDALHAVERWTFIDTDTIKYEITLEDPRVFTRPWKMAFPIGRDKETGNELLEWACLEGERSAQNMLRSTSK